MPFLSKQVSLIYVHAKVPFCNPFTTTNVHANNCMVYMHNHGKRIKGAETAMRRRRLIES